MRAVPRRSDRSRISWTQVETGSAITWKYPSCVLKGDGSVGEFYSVALTNHAQQADTGTKMIHLGRNTKSTIISKGISAGRGDQTYRGLVRMGKKAPPCILGVLENDPIADAEIAGFCQIALAHPVFPWALYSILSVGNPGMNTLL